MGEEAQQEKTKAAEEKKEEKIAEEAAAEKKLEAEEEKKEEPKPTSPVVLFVDLHCVGCAKKIEKSILKNRGVEEVVIDMGKNQVTIKGIVEPEAICNKITKKTKRIAKVVSPLPPAEGQPIPQIVASQVSGITTVELNVNMHCEACALQLKRKILKMKGVRTVETELSSGKVTVSGTMDGNKLVEFVYRRTKKQAKIVPQPQPQPPDEPDQKPPAEEASKPTDQEEVAKEAEKPAAAKDEEPKSEDKKEGEAAAAATDKPPEVEEKKETTAEDVELAAGGENKEEEVQSSNSRIMYEDQDHDQEQAGMQRMMYYYQPLYVIERIPPPQLFSDENPNACSIS